MHVGDPHCAQTCQINLLLVRSLVKGRLKPQALLQIVETLHHHC